MPERMWERDPEGGGLRRAPARHPPEPDPSGQPPEGSGAPLGPASLGISDAGRAVWKGVRDGYDYLGTVVLASFVWSLLAAALAVGGYELARQLTPSAQGATALGWAGRAVAVGLPLVLLMGPLTAGLFRFIRNACAHAEPEVFDLFWGFRAAAGRSIGLALTQAVVAAVLAGDGIFFLSLGGLPFLAVGVLFGYLLLFWLLACGYQWPLLAEQELGVWAAVRKSLLLVLDNLWFSVIVGMALLGLTLFSAALVLPAMVLWPALAAFILTRAVRALLQRYDLLPPDPDATPDPGDSWGRGWHE